jgi:uncharacterized membrane protein
MEINPQILLLILGMGLVTYATRAGGIWLLGRVKLSRRVELGLKNVPGAIFVSLIAPVVLTAGIAEAVAGVATGAVALGTGSLVLSMAVGVGVVWAFRTFI